MKDLLQQYAAFNVWANQQIIQVILNLPEEQQNQEVPSSFNSLARCICGMRKVSGGSG
jgi:uncharacterized damage-inducible protein DinB